MQQFILEQNIAHFETLLIGAADPVLQNTLRSLLSSSKRDLAILNSKLAGADMSPLEQCRRKFIDREAVLSAVRPVFDNAPHPYMLLDPGPGLRIVDINEAYAHATLITRADVVGKLLFDVFPDNPDDALADGVSNLFASLRFVAQTSQPHAMAVQRYDIRDPNGSFVERHWQPVNTPVCDNEGRLVFILHHVEDVTDGVRGAIGDVGSASQYAAHRKSEEQGSRSR
jgi:PAS domain-containing protein